MLLRVGFVYITIDNQCRIPTLKDDRQSLKEMFDFHCVILSPSTRIETSYCLEEFGGICVPASKGFHDEGLKGDAMRSAVVVMYLYF